VGTSAGRLVAGAPAIFVELPATAATTITAEIVTTCRSARSARRFLIGPTSVGDDSTCKPSVLAQERQLL
jgi:hypothetical protein